MKKHQRFVWLAPGCLFLAACGAATEARAPDDAPAEEARCGQSASEVAVDGERYRAWVLFRVDDPQVAAAQFGVQDEKGVTPLTEGGGNYVIVRADVVDGDEDYNLVVPVDAADEGQFQVASDRLTAVVGARPKSVLRVAGHFPTPPHCSHTFVTEEELKSFYLEEYAPPGRHPQSPGANPWG